MTWSIESVFRNLERFTLLPRMGHDVDTPVEPELSPDELVAVRQLIEERFPLTGPYTSPDSAWGNESSPAAGFPAPAGVGGEVGAPPTPTSPHSPDLATWLEPAVLTILEAHEYRFGHDTNCECGAPSIWTWSDWQEHVATDIGRHIARALPDFPGGVR